MPEWITTIEAVEMAKMIMEKAERQRAEFAQRQADAMKCAGCEELRTDNARLRGLLREAAIQWGLGVDTCGMRQVRLPKEWYARTLKTGVLPAPAAKGWRDE